MRPSFPSKTLGAAVAVAVALALPALAVAQGGGQAPAPAPGQPPAAPAPPPPTPKLVVDKPTRKQILIREGHGGRLRLGGRWYFRLDDAFLGDRQRFYAQRSLSGWSAISVPHNWNAQDLTENRPSVGWYRKEFRAPGGPRGRRWKVRFEGANHRTTVFLNGKQIGRNAGGYVPFEVELKGLKRGRNRLVAKVSTLRSNLDLTHWRPAKYNGFGTSGWWNFGGLLREVYVRPVDTLDLQAVRVLPRIRCARCDARADVRIRIRNASDRGQNAQIASVLSGRKGTRGRRTQRSAGFKPGQVREITARIPIRNPRLWHPGKPNRYGLTVSAAAGGRRVASYRLAFGVRHLGRTRDGTLLINGKRVRLRGASIHEDDPRTGGVATPGIRRQTLRHLRQLGANVTRGHHLLHPATMEALDRAGILYWSQAPIYQLTNAMLDRPATRRAAIAANHAMVRAGANHPSIFVWSLGNELASGPEEVGRIGPGFSAFVRDASRVVRRLDDTRLVGLDRHTRVGEPIFHPVFNRLDILGVNEYFGWYSSAAPGVPPTRTEDLPGQLDRIHQAYPRMPLVITEFGAESTRNGPVDQKGSLEFQEKYVRDHYAIHASKKFVNGSIVWILKDFRVYPEWLGGADPAWATPPWNNKGLIDEKGTPKPAFTSLSRLWRGGRRR
jgi:beta-glucuronidase